MVGRSRLFVVLGVVGCALAVIFHDGLASYAFMFAALAFAAIYSFMGLARMRRRLVAFTVADGHFTARNVHVQGVYAMAALVATGGQAGLTLRNFASFNPTLNRIAWVQLGVTALFGIVSIALALLAWGADASIVTLTPQGVVAKRLWDRVTIPWEALPPDGPARPGLLDGRIRLALARPELVRRSRLRLPGVGNCIPAQTDVHPWLVADAIRWYAEHPEDRPAIGTEAEHTRLLAALAAGAYGVGPPPTPGLPAPVRAAIRLGYTGIVFGLVTALSDAVLTFALEDRLKARAVEPADQEIGAHFTQAIFVIMLLVMVLLAALGFMAIRTLKRGDEVGRIGLIAVSAVAAVWAVMPCFDLASQAPPGLEPLLITMSGLKRLVYLGLGAAVLVLLLMPASRAFTRREPI
jgi:hypothetical protein